MNEAQIENWRSLFRQIKIQKNGDQLAPHKPLLLLSYLGFIWQNEKSPRLKTFEEIRPAFTELLNRYSFAKSKQTPENPFARLIVDQIWQYDGPDFDAGKNVPSAKVLTDTRAEAGFSEELYNDLRSSPLLISTLAEDLLAHHFAESLHNDILDSVGLTYRLDTPGIQIDIRRKRNPDFRKQVAKAYEHRCAVCKASLRIDLIPVALEAAHIKWHARNGPDSTNNGLLLCSIHHKLLDLGAFSLNQQLKIEIANSVESHQAGFDYWLGNFHDKEIVIPKSEIDHPQFEFIQWHRKNIFRN